MIFIAEPPMTGMHTMRPWFAPVWLIVLIAPWQLSVTAAAERAEVMAALHSLTKEGAQQFVEILADDSFEGREAGSRGGRAAGNLLMKEFEKLDLKPAGGGGTFFSGVTETGAEAP